MPIRTTTTAWSRAGMFALPLYGILLFVGTLTPQPDQTTDPEAWARFVRLHGARSRSSRLLWAPSGGVVTTPRLFESVDAILTAQGAGR